MRGHIQNLKTTNKTEAIKSIIVFVVVLISVILGLRFLISSFYPDDISQSRFHRRVHHFEPTEWYDQKSADTPWLSDLQNDPVIGSFNKKWFILVDNLEQGISDVYDTTVVFSLLGIDSQVSAEKIHKIINRFFLKTDPFTKKFAHVYIVYDTPSSDFVNTLKSTFPSLTHDHIRWIEMNFEKSLERPLAVASVVSKIHKQDKDLLLVDLPSMGTILPDDEEVYCGTKDYISGSFKNILEEITIAHFEVSVLDPSWESLSFSTLTNQSHSIVLYSKRVINTIPTDVNTYYWRYDLFANQKVVELENRHCFQPLKNIMFDFTNCLAYRLSPCPNSWMMLSEKMSNWVHRLTGKN